MMLLKSLAFSSTSSWELFTMMHLKNADPLTPSPHYWFTTGHCSWFFIDGWAPSACHRLQRPHWNVHPTLWDQLSATPMKQSMSLPEWLATSAVPTTMPYSANCFCNSSPIHYWILLTFTFHTVAYSQSLVWQHTRISSETIASTFNSLATSPLTRITNTHLNSIYIWWGILKNHLPHDHLHYPPQTWVV